MASKKVASFVQKTIMHDYMLAHSQALSGPNDRQWHIGWNYEHVGAAAGLSANHARRLAKELELTIVAAPPPPSPEERIASLEMQIGLIQSAINQLDIVLTSIVKNFIGEPDASETEEWQRSVSDERGSQSEPVGARREVRAVELHSGPSEPLSEASGEGAAPSGGVPVPGPTRSLLTELAAGRRKRVPAAAPESVKAAEDNESSSSEEASTG